jgi:hypothetical protein
MNATMDIAAARHALSVAVEACTRLGIEEAAVGRWQTLLKQRPPYVVDSRGAPAEWAWPGLVTPDDHRHVSHLYPVCPFTRSHRMAHPSWRRLRVARSCCAATRTSPHTGACTGRCARPG